VGLNSAEESRRLVMSRNDLRPVWSLSSHKNGKTTTVP
jgi:hypothetical protein